MRQLEVSLTIQIPPDFVMIKKVELEELQQEKLCGVYWTMKDLEKRTNKKQEWLKNNILFVPNFKKELDVKNRGFVYYPRVKGEPWSFQASKMAKFLDENFYLIFGGK